MKKEKSGKLPGLAGTLLLLATACAPAAKVAVPPPAQIPAKVVTVTPASRPAEPEMVPHPAAGTGPVATEAAAPQVVIKEKLILPDPQMYAARYRHYVELKKKYDELLFHLDWISTEKTSPELGQCIAAISAIVDGYGQVNQDEMVDYEHKTEGDKPWQVVWQDLAFVQGTCPAFYEAKVKEIAGHLQGYKGEAAAQAGQLVSEYATQQDDAKAIESFKYLTENFPEWQRDPAILRQYGEALLRQGQLEEASTVFSEILGDPSTVKETIALYRRSADLLLAVGKTAEATRQFHALKEIEQAAASRDMATDASLDLLEGRQDKEPLLSIYQNFLWEYYSYDGKKSTAKASTALSQLESFFPENPLTDNARQLFAAMQEKVRADVEGQLAAASKFLEEKKYDQAKQTLSSIKTEELPQELADKVRFKMQEILFDEQEEQKSSAWAEEQHLEQLWQQASQYFDQHRFDDAIGACSAFAGTEYEQQATDLVARAVEQAAVELRKKAAAFYLRARRENDLSRRSGYLQESLALLREIETKYPQASVIEKVKSNIAVLVGELQALGISEEPASSIDLTEPSGLRE